MSTDNGAPKISTLDELVQEPTEEHTHSNLADISAYLTGEHKKLVSKSNYGQDFNVYWQNKETQLLTVDLIHYYGHIISTPLSILKNFIYFKENETKSPDLDYQGLWDMCVNSLDRLKALTGEILSLYEQDHIRFELCNPDDGTIIKHEEIWKDFKTIQEQLALVVHPKADDISGLGQFGSVINELMKIRSKYTTINSSPHGYGEFKDRIDAFNQSE